MTLFEFLGALEARKIHYELGRHRDDTIMVKAAVPGERWEIEFFDDGGIEVEIFRSAEMLGAEGGARLFREQDGKAVE